MKNKIYVVSFGNNDYYSKLSNYNVNKIRHRSKNTIGLVYDKDDLPIEMIDFCEQNKKGYGFWVWKPYIIKKTFEVMNENDILLYIDGRIFYTGGKISEIETLIDDKGLDAIFWKLDDLLEYQYSKGDFFRLLEVYDPEIKTSSQIGATFFYIKKNIRTIELINKWYELMNTNRQLLTDDASIEPNENGFITNRFDQSILSLLIKSSKGLNVKLISNKQVSRGPIKPHSLPHENDFPFLFNIFPLWVRRIAYVFKKSRPLNAIIYKFLKKK